MSFALAAAAGCTGENEPIPTPVEEITTTTVITRTIALASVVPGDCLTGLVVGIQERVQTKTTTLIGCSQAHEVELGLRLDLEPLVRASLPASVTTTQPGPSESDESTTTTTADVNYPGTQQVVEYADEGCTDRFEQLVPDTSQYRLLTIWPTFESWTVHDRSVVCLASSIDGSLFVGRTLPISDDT